MHHIYLLNIRRRNQLRETWFLAICVHCARDAIVRTSSSYESIFPVLFPHSARGRYAHHMRDVFDSTLRGEGTGFQKGMAKMHRGISMCGSRVPISTSLELWIKSTFVLRVSQFSVNSDNKFKNAVTKWKIPLDVPSLGHCLFFLPKTSWLHTEI